MKRMRGERKVGMEEPNSKMVMTSYGISVFL